MSKIFISYRRDDSSGYAGRLYDRLSQHFGINQVFMDVDHIEPGEDFAEIINQAVGSCSILLALIGRSWITAADKNGARRLDDPEDFVRLEITSAISSNVRVMPLLVDGASMPLAHQLPEALTLLARRQAAELSNTRFHQDVDRLIENIEKALVVKSAAPLASSQPLSPTQEIRPPTQDDKQTEPVELPDVEQPAQQPRTLLELSPKRNVQKLLITAVSLFLLFAAGLWYWDAFHRPHYEYYANAITRWGLPDGVGQLSMEQMRHRNASLEFIRKGRQGDVQEVRVVNSRGKYPPVFASSGSDLSRFMPLARDTFGSFSIPTYLLARRVVFERSHDGRILAQRVYNASEQVLYTLQYLEPNLAKFGDGPFAEAIRESGISHVRFVRTDTGPEAGRYTEMLFLDSSGKPKPARDGTYGIRYAFNSPQHVVEAINLDQKGDPVPDKVGIVRVIMTYDDTWGNMIRLKNLDADGQSIANSTGAAELTMSYDRYGNLQQLVCLDKDGRPVTQRALGAAIRTMAYDDRGNLIENTFQDPNHKLVKGAFGFAKQTVSWNEQGDSTETYFGPDDQPQLIKGRAVKLKGKWDERGNLLVIEHLDEHDRLIRANDGCAKITFAYDNRGNINEQACFDERGGAVRNTDGWAKAKLMSDDRGNTIEKRYFGPANQPELYEERFVKIKLKYNEQNKQTEEAYFDTKDRPVKNKTGYAKTTYSYDTRGKLVQVSFFDEKGQSTARKGGYAQIVRVYDDRGNIAEETLLDPQGKPRKDNEEGYSRTRFKYDDRGYRTETAHFDENDRLILHSEGYARLRSKYNHSGQVIERALFGLNDSLILHKKLGYSRRRWTYDHRGNVSQIAYFGTNDHAARNTLGYALVRFLYDKLGRETRREFFDVDGAPVRTRVAVDTVEPDSNGRSFLNPGDLLMDYDGNEIVDTRVFYELELESGESRRELRVQRAGKLLTVEVPPGRLKGIETMDKVSPEARKTGA